jgi:large subunit ribosomal protein L18
MKKSQIKNSQRVARHKRIRAKVIGTAECPRLAVFRSNRFIYVQLIDDNAGKTLAAADSRQVKTGTPVERATTVGDDVAKKAKAAGITKVVFDRGGFRYQGAVAAVAEAARAGGLTF